MTNEQIGALFERETRLRKKSKRQITIREKSRNGLVTREWLESVEITCRNNTTFDFDATINMQVSMPVNMRKTTLNAFRDEY